MSWVNAEKKKLRPRSFGPNTILLEDGASESFVDAAPPRPVVAATLEEEPTPAAAVPSSSAAKAVDSSAPLTETIPKSEPAATAPSATSEPASTSTSEPANTSTSEPASTSTSTPPSSSSSSQAASSSGLLSVSNASSRKKRGSSIRGRSADKSEWVEGQKHTFTAWLNFQLRDIEPPVVVKDLVADLQDGVVLCLLANKLIAGSKPVRFTKKPVMKVQKVENIGQAIAAFTGDGLKLVNVGAEDVHDGNQTIVLGLIWSIILKYQVGGVVHNDDDDDDDDGGDGEVDEFAFNLKSTGDEDSSSAGKSSGGDASLLEAKNRLLEWVRKRCEPFGVKVNNFGADFADGLAFSALTASIDERYNFFADNEAGTPKETMERSFDFNDKELAIPRLLNPDYLAAPLVPDEKSVMTYVSLLYQYHGGKKAVVPEEEVELHIDITGEGLKTPVVGRENSFSVTVRNSSTSTVLPSSDQLSCTITNKATGLPVDVRKQVTDQGATRFVFEPTGSDPLDVVLVYANEQIVAMTVNPAAAYAVDWDGRAADGTDLSMQGAEVPVGTPCRLGGVLRDHRGNVVAPGAGDVRARVVAPDGSVSDVPVVARSDGSGFDVTFTPAVVGTHTVLLSVHGVEVAPRTVVATPRCSVDWDLFSASALPVGVPCRVGGVLRDRHGNVLPVDADVVAVVTAPDGSVVPSSLVANAQGGFDVVFTPPLVGDYTVTLQQAGAPLGSKTVQAVRAQVVPINKPAHIVVTEVPAALVASFDTKVHICGPDGQPVKGSVDLGTNYAPLCVDFTPTQCGVYRLVVDGGETVLTLPPVVARDDIDIVHKEAVVTQECELRIPWTSSYDDDAAVVVLLPPPDSALGKTDVKIVERGTSPGGQKWVVARFTPDVEGDFHVAAASDDGVQCMQTVPAHSLKRSDSKRSKRKRPKAVEVVSVTPVDKPGKGLVRIYLGDDDLPQLLGLVHNFRTHPLTAATTYQEIRDTLLRKFSAAIDEKARKKMQAIVKRDHNCIVFVDERGGEKMAPLNGLVLPDINRFKKETAERILRAAQQAGRDEVHSDASPLSSSASSSAAASSSSSSSSSHHHKEGPSFRERRAKKKADPHGTRAEIERARLAEKERAKQLSQVVGAGTGWNQKAGTFKLEGTIHVGEQLTTLKRSDMGLIYCEVRYEEQTFKTPKWDLKSGEPEWESKFQITVSPGRTTDLVVQLKHTGNDAPLGVIIIPLLYLQPDMAKKAWYVVKKPDAMTSLSRRRLLITLEHHVLEIEPHTRLFLKPAPRLYLEILVNYPHTHLKMGEQLLITSEVRDETKNFCLTDDLKGGVLQLFVLPPGAAQPIILEPQNTNVGIFTFTFKPAQPGRHRAMLKYNGAAMQHKLATIEVSATRKVLLR